MKKIKVILYFFVLLLLTGCTAEVNIDLKETYLTENITIVDKEVKENEIASRYRKYMPAYYDDIIDDSSPDTRVEGFTYYNRTLKELNDGYAVSYSRNFSLKEYNKANSFKSTFRSGAVEYSKEDGIINIYTDSNGLLLFDTYPNLSSVKVNITTKLEVLDNNADEVEGNTYSWIISRDDKERNIYLETKNKNYDKNHNDKKNEKKSNEKNKKNNGIYVLIVFLCLLGFLILVFALNSFASKLGR